MPRCEASSLLARRVPWKVNDTSAMRFHLHKSWNTCEDTGLDTGFGSGLRVLGSSARLMYTGFTVNHGICEIGDEEHGDDIGNKKTCCLSKATRHNPSTMVMR